MRRWGFSLALVACGALLACIAAGSMLSHPVPAQIGNAPADLVAENVTFASASRSTIHGWWCPSPTSNAVVLLLPGVRANRLSMVDRARFLRAHGYSVLLIDFQATGESPGDAITFGWRERLDVLAAVTFVRTRAPRQRVAILGSSLGGAAALLASPPLRVDAMIVEAVYPDVDAAVKNRLRMRLGVAGDLLAPALLLQLQPRLGVSSRVLRPIDHIARVGCPVLIIGGMNDRHTTPSETRAMYAAARQPKALWLVPGAAHVDLHAAALGEYEARVLRFLATPAKPRA